MGEDYSLSQPLKSEHKREGAMKITGAGANVGALLMSRDAAFIAGSAFLMDGGVTVSDWCGALAAPP